MAYNLMDYTKNDQFSNNKYDLMKYAKANETSYPSSMADFRKIEDTTPLPDTPPVKQPSLWDQIKVGDIKGLSSRIQPFHDDMPDSYYQNQAPPISQSDATLIQHNPSLLETLGNSLSGIGKAFKSGGENSPLVTGLTKAFLGDQYNSTPTPTPYTPQNIPESIASGIGEQAAEWPLWMAGGALSKGLMGAEKVAPIISKLPGLVQTGIDAGLTYGGAVAPMETALQGDGSQGLIEREKQVPAFMLGGAALHGAGQLIGKGIEGVGNYLADRRLGELTQPLGEAVQNQFNAPSLHDVQLANPITRSVQRSADLGPLRISDTLTPEYKAKQAELNDVFKNKPLAEQPLNPVTNTTLQQNIDNSLGIGKSTEQYQGLDVFGKPLQSYKINNDTQNAIAEISSKMDQQVQDIASSLKQMDNQTRVGSIRNQIKDLGGISQGNPNIFEEQKVIPNWIRNNITGRPLDEVADTLGMNSDELLAAISDSAYKPRDYVTEAYRIAHNDPEYQALSNTLDTLKNELPGKKTLQEAIPKHDGIMTKADINLKPRELTSKSEQLPNEQLKGLSLSGNLPVDEPLARPVKKLQPVKREPLTWTNRDNIPVSNTESIKPMPEQTLEEALKSGDSGPQTITSNETVPAPIGEPKLATEQPSINLADTKIPDTSIQPSVDDNTFWNKIKSALGWKGNVSVLQNGIKTGKVDIGELPVEDQSRIKMNLQMFAKPNEYVDTKPIDINIGKSDKQTAIDTRQGYVGKLNKQIVTGNQLRDTMQQLAPKEQEGIQLFLDAGGDINHLNEMANNPDPVLDSFIPNTKTTYIEAYNQALNLSPNAHKAAEMAQKYYEESGKYALNTGSTRSIIENYANRMWKQEPSGNVKTEVRQPGLNPFTSHSKQRFYETMGEGILNGKEPATLNAGDLLSIHNQEMARANTNRELAKALESKGLGVYQFEKPTQGFTAIDSLSRDIPTMHDGKPAIIRQNFVIPDGIAKGLQAITDPNYMAKVDALRHLQAYQGVVKTIDLSFSLFHHITLAAEALYNSRGGLDFIKNWDKMSKLGSESFNAAEKWGAEHGLMTTKIDDNYDILRQLAGKGSIIDKAWNSDNKLAKGAAAIPKGLASLSNKNSEFLFGKIQRWLKVMDFQNKASEFVGKNPNMKNAEVTKGLRQIASEINDSYGGLNWKAMGVTPSVQALSRLGFLAPDWTFSSARMLGRATGLGNIERGAGILQNTKNVIKGNPGNAAARTEFAVALVGGAILTEGLNKILTGHYTNQNPKGHELQVEVQPGVFISFFRSGIGDVTKWSANMLTQGPLGGTINTIQGKGSPLVRTLVGQLANKQFTGAPITNSKNTPLQNDLARIKELASSFAPMPFGISGTARYLKSGDATPLGTGLTGTGAATYSKVNPLNPLANPSSAYAGNWLNDLLSPSSSASDALISKINAQNKAQNNQTTLIKQSLGKALTTGGSTSDVFSKYNVPVSERSQLLKDAKSAIVESQKSPLVQKFDSLSKSGQQKFLQSLTSNERATLMQEKPKLK
ncbi:MAG: hypothetical protein Q8911_00090 [Bacillota bacterium]|nr:hypothetical protein [Bacillota bacterium]